MTNAIIGAIVAVVLGFVALFFKTKAQKDAAQQKVAELQTGQDLTEEKVKYEEAKTKGNDAEADYHAAADDFRKRFGGGK